MAVYSHPYASISHLSSSKYVEDHCSFMEAVKDQAFFRAPAGAKDAGQKLLGVVK